jgi:hypothetical protein
MHDDRHNESWKTVQVTETMNRGTGSVQSMIKLECHYANMLLFISKEQSSSRGCRSRSPLPCPICRTVPTTKAYLLVPKVECRVQYNYVLDTTSPQFFMRLGQIKILELGMLPVRSEL